jgi:hypothetical protein
MPPLLQLLLTRLILVNGGPATANLPRHREIQPRRIDLPQVNCVAPNLPSRHSMRLWLDG